MGRDKAALPFGDESLLERILRIVRPRVDEGCLSRATPPKDSGRSRG